MSTHCNSQRSTFSIVIAISIIFNLATPAKAASDIGVLLLGGKGGTDKWVKPLARSLNKAGLKAVTMRSFPWGKGRIYDKTFEASMEEVHGIVRKMQQRRGIKRIVLGGHSLGAIVAAGYAAKYGGLAGVIFLAPGHFVSYPGFRKRLKNDWKRAEENVKAGNGKRTGRFADINKGKTSRRRVSSEVYLSWFKPTGPADFPSNMKNIMPGIAGLYVAAGQDRIPQTKNRKYAFDHMPGHTRNQFVIIKSARHLNLPRKSARVVFKWLKGL